MSVMNFWFATNNAHKNKELEAILGVSLKIPKPHGLNFDPEETGTTFHDNALIKAKDLQRILCLGAMGENNAVIADDSGLCVDGLGGRPGVLSARYGMENGKQLSSAEQNILLLEELGDNPVRSARFVCSMALLLGSDRFYIFQETLEGEIVKKSGMKGEGGFGYDPIFFLPEFGKTLAELSQEEKNAISHRGKAGKQIANIIKMMN